MREIYALPIYTFWELARNIERLRAEEDLRLMMLLGASFSSEAEVYANKLVEARGDIVEVREEVLVREGLAILKNALGGAAINES